MNDPYTKLWGSYIVSIEVADSHSIWNDSKSDRQGRSALYAPAVTPNSELVVFY